MLKKKIGHIVSGSLEEGLLMHIDASTNTKLLKRANLFPSLATITNIFL